MFSSPVTKKTLLLFLLFSGLIIAIKIVYTITDNRTRIVFCDVGQGDAAYIRVRNKIDILIDAGPDRKVLSCLGKYMPFYDRQIELAFLSHPQKDHFGGYIFILDRYKVSLFLLNGIENKSHSFSLLKNKLHDKKIRTKIMLRGDKVILNNFRLNILWPEKSATLTFSNLNLSSQVILLSGNNFKILFTGDLEFNNIPANSISLPSYIDILKVPHHGSKNGLTEGLIKKTKPKIAIISVGKNNAYGHPTKQVLDILRKYNVEVRRTDVEGNIVFKINN